MFLIYSHAKLLLILCFCNDLWIKMTSWFHTLFQNLYSFFNSLNLNNMPSNSRRKCREAWNCFKIFYILSVIYNYTLQNELILFTVKEMMKKSFFIKMILLTSQLPHQQPNQLKPDAFNLSQEFLACVCSRRQSLRGRNLEDSRGVKRRGGLWLGASGGHTLLILKVWFSMQEVYATKLQILRVYCC